MGWCSQWKVDPFTASVAVVGDFLLHMYDQKLAISTLEGYRMAIANTLRAMSNVEVGRCDTLKARIRNLQIDRVRTRRPPPDWDLSLVLHWLRLPPFEPLRSCSLQFFTWKTVFLLAFASGKRRSELHAFLFATFARAEDWSSVSFSVSPSFLAKTALTDREASALLSVSIPALSSFVSDLLLCPVRAIRIYIDRTSLMRDNKCLFFISYLDHIQKDISSVSLSRWIVKTIQLCYELEGAKLRSSAKAHSVRALSVISFFKQASMEQELGFFLTLLSPII